MPLTQLTCHRGAHEQQFQRRQVPALQVLLHRAADGFQEWPVGRVLATWRQRCGAHGQVKEELGDALGEEHVLLADHPVAQCSGQLPEHDACCASSFQTLKNDPGTWPCLPALCSRAWREGVISAVVHGAAVCSLDQHWHVALCLTLYTGRSHVNATVKTCRCALQ
jgi:hypothetical protein